MRKANFSIFKPLPALTLYISYIILLQILKLYIEESLGYAILIWIGSIFYIYLVVYSFKSIIKAGKNSMFTGKAIFNIVVAALSGVIFFAINYFYIYQISNTNFIGSIGENPIEIFISFLYFSFATFATVGFGDIVPISTFAKILCILEIIYSFFIIVIFFSGFDKIKNGLNK